MPGIRSREEAANVQLAIVLSELGVDADAETIHHRGKHRPDVLFLLRGLRVVVEGKFADHSSAEDQVLRDARGRVSSGVAHIAAAVVYPKGLRSVATAKLAAALRLARLRWRILSEAGETEQWAEGDPAQLMGALRRAQESLTSDDLVAKAAEGLRMQLETVAALWQGQEGAADNLSLLLGMKPPKDEDPEARAARRKTAARISALVIANAFIFQEQLAASDGRVGNLSWLDDQADVITAARERWRWIYVNVNYRPIFELGERVLGELPHSRNTMITVRNLLREARAICGNQAALRHDLMGRIYHWLLYHAKYLGTYYTKTSAATLLLGLAMSRTWTTDFGDPHALADFKVADLACGTGTLLMAAAQALSDSYIRERAASGRSLTPVDLRTLHQALMQNVLHGYDVLPSAVHLTASTLALLAPDVAFNHMNLWVMPMGVIAGNPRLGSLDFLAAKSGEVQVQITLDLSQSEREDVSAETVRTGAGSRRIAVARIPDLDLCVMNPPFVRSVGGNLLFGSLPDDERAALQKELKKQAKSFDAEITAGLGSVFVALADQHVKPGGRLAFVLPAALASGEAWAATRRLIGERYELEFVVASHDAETPNFSENTALSELLFVARRLTHDEKPARTTYINLWRNPQSIHEALDLVARIAAAGSPARIEDAGFATIPGEGRKLGEVVGLPAVRAEANWTGALFAQTELLRTAVFLERGEFVLPGQKTSSMSLCQLVQLGAIGPDRKRISEGFVPTRDD